MPEKKSIFKVNNELNELYNGINLVQRYLKPASGRLACISFHSLEDKIIKGLFNDVELNTVEDIEEEPSKKKNKSMIRFKMNPGLSVDSFTNTVKRSWTPLNKKVILPSDLEVQLNPRARSAKLRIACKNF